MVLNSSCLGDIIGNIIINNWLIYLIVHEFGHACHLLCL